MLQDNMDITASEIKEKLARGEYVSKEDRTFFRSYITAKSNTNAGNAGKVSMKTKVRKGY